MPKVIVFSILWGFVWESLLFNFFGLYLFSTLAAAFVFAYSPLIVRLANIVIGFAVLWALMFLWVFIIADYQVPSINFVFHISYYTTISIAFMSFIYVFEKKQ